MPISRPEGNTIANSETYSSSFIAMSIVLLFCLLFSGDAARKHTGAEIQSVLQSDNNLASKLDMYNIKNNQSYIIGHSLVVGMDGHLPAGANGMRGFYLRGTNLRGTSFNWLCEMAQEINQDSTIKSVIIYLGNNDYNKDRPTDKNAKEVYKKLLVLASTLAQKKVFLVGLAGIRHNQHQSAFAFTVNELLKQGTADHAYTFIPDPISHIPGLVIQEKGFHPIGQDSYNRILYYIYDYIPVN